MSDLFGIILMNTYLFIMLIKPTGRFFYLIMVFFFSTACQTDGGLLLKKKKGSKTIADLEKIQSRGKIRALTGFGQSSYFIYRGEPMGYEYELLQRFADHLKVDLEIILTPSMDSIFEPLLKGEVDVVAHGLTITRERKQEVLFTDYLYLTHQVLVQKKPDNWRTLHWRNIHSALVHDAIDLIGDTVSVRKNSSFIKRLENLSDELGGTIYIDTLPSELSTDEIIRMVAMGEIKFSVADDNVASINASYYPILDISVPISFSQRIAWAVHPEAIELHAALNEWIAEMKRQADYNVIYNKYFRNARGFRKRIRSPFFSLNERKISPYDELIQQYAEELGWDWRLLTALIYQESQFNPQATSWAGARGLMQLMPATARAMGVRNLADPEQSIGGGTAYLKKVWEMFDAVEDSIQRIKLTLAAYNCGPYHVKDAQRLAKKRGLDPNIWEDNVAEMILALSSPQVYTDPVVRYGYVRGLEPYNYVNQIFERYRHYTQFFGLIQAHPS